MAAIKIADGGGSALIAMMGASGKGRARRGAQAERAAPDLAEADLTTKSADRLARRQHVKGEAGGKRSSMDTVGSTIGRPCQVNELTFLQTHRSEGPALAWPSARTSAGTRAALLVHGAVLRTVPTAIAPGAPARGHQSG